MIAMGLCEICLNQLEEIKNGSVCCKAFPDGIPEDHYCYQHCDLEFMEGKKELPVINCPNGYHFELPEKFFEKLREYAKNNF